MKYPGQPLAILGSLLLITGIVIQIAGCAAVHDPSADPIRALSTFIFGSVLLLAGALFSSVAYLCETLHNYFHPPQPTTKPPGP